VHTSAKVRLTSVVIQIHEPDRHQNVIICSLVHCQPSLKISCDLFGSFFCVKLLTDRQTDKQTNKQRRLHILLGRGSEKHKPTGDCDHKMLTKRRHYPYW